MSCKHMKANQLVSEVYYQGFNTDLEGVGGCSGFKEPADLSVAQSLMQISGSLRPARIVGVWR